MKPAAILCMLFTCISYACAESNWLSPPGTNVPVCTAGGDQHFPSLVPDGEGGVIVVWHDARSGDSTLYAQRIDRNGRALWEKDGIRVCLYPKTQWGPHAVSDDNGGAIVVWSDMRNNGDRDIYAQRLSRDGELLWKDEGVPVCVVAGLQEELSVERDGNGGVFIVWEDWRAGNQDLFMQHLRSDGSPVWRANGIPLIDAPGDQYNASIAPDTEGGLVASWWDISMGKWNIFAQKISPTGDRMWPPSGVLVCTNPGNQAEPKTISDGSGGAFVLWVDYRNDGGTFNNGDLYVQHIDSNGKLSWDSNGVELCIQPRNQQQVVAVPDGEHGLIAAWWDERNVYSDIYAARINIDGEILWEKAICQAPGEQRDVRIAPHDGGAIIYWRDYREDYGPTVAEYLFAQLVRIDGTVVGMDDGTPVSTAGGEKINHTALSVNANSTFFAWSDSRSGECDIYIERIDWE